MELRMLLAVLAGTLLAAPAFAPAFAQKLDGATGELRREYGRGGVPSIPYQDRDAALADEFAPRGAYGLLRAAQEQIASGRYGPANELIERAETRLLTRSTWPWQAGVPVEGGPVRWLGNARAALIGGNPGAAQQQVARAMDAMERYRPRG